MRRVVFCLLCLALSLCFGVAASGGERRSVSGAPSTKEVVFLALSDVPAERRLAAQHLQQAGSKALLAFFDALRKRMGLQEEDAALSPLALARRRIQEAKPGAKAKPPMLHTETWIVTLSPSRLARLLKQVGITLEGDAAILDEGGAEAFRQAVKTDPKMLLRCAPRLSMRDGKPASLTLAEQRNYVRAYRIVQAHGRQIADPQVDQVTSGVVLHLQGHLASDGKNVTMDVRATWGDVPGPLPVYEHRLEKGPPLKVQVPTTHVTVMQTSVAVPDGQYALLAGPARPSGEATLLLLRVLSQRAPGKNMPALGASAPQAPRDETLITLAPRVIDVPVEAAAALFGRTRPTAEKNVVLLDEATAKALLTRVEAGERAEGGVRLVTAPRLTAYSAQKANVSVLKEIAYVKDYEVEQRTGSQVASPIIGTLKEGVVLDLTSRAPAGKGTIAIDLLVTSAFVKRPMAEKKVACAGTVVTIQVPETHVRRFHAALEVPDGGWALVGDGGVLEPESGRRVERVVLLQASVVTPEDAAAVKRAAPPKKR